MNDLCENNCFFFWCDIRKVVNSLHPYKEMRMTGVKSPLEHVSAGREQRRSLKLFLSNLPARQSGSKPHWLLIFLSDACGCDKDGQVEDKPLERETEQRAQTPAVIQRLDVHLREHSVICKRSDGAAQSSEEQQPGRSCRHLPHSWVHLKHPQALGFPNIPLHTWSRAPPRGPGLAAGLGFPVGLQQHPLVQVHRPAAKKWLATLVAAGEMWDHI